MTAPSGLPDEPARHRDPGYTSADWWVTVGRSSADARRHLDDAQSAPDLLHTLTEISRADTATTVAVGAAVNALLASGHSWEAIAAALGHADPAEARRRTDDGRTGARRALLARLDHPHPGYAPRGHPNSSRWPAQACRLRCRYSRSRH
ncbi:hypothetical protein [Streptomyces atratus]|uniref:hypothetical protein n=1 Tax=Streptomyces atratus TaxID=1893 RepID=UPI0033EB3792